MFRIRPAQPSDLDRIRAIQLASWRQTYAGVLPERYLADEVECDLRRTWTASRLKDALVLVADRDGVVMGFAATLPDAAGGPYLDNLHIDEAARRLGVGRELMAGTAEALRARGHGTLRLTVAEGNDRARQFYRRMGGIEEPPIEDNMFGHPVTAQPVRWSDLDGLVALKDRKTVRN